MINLAVEIPRYGLSDRKWYRVAYYLPYKDYYVLYPIGLHLIVRFVRRLWEWSFYYKLSKLESMLEERYETGRLDERRQQEAEMREKAAYLDSLISWKQRH